jgi:hypothetical protein
MKQAAAMAARIVDLVQSLLDPFDRALGEFERKARVGAGCELCDRIESVVDALRPVPRLFVIDVTPGPGRPINRRFQFRLKRLVVCATGGGGKVQFAERGRLGLREANDHFDERLETLCLQMVADARERATAFQRVVAKGVGGERCCDNMLANAPVCERRA